MWFSYDEPSRTDRASCSPGGYPVSFSNAVDRTRIRSQRVLWDHATLAAQLNITVPAANGLAR
jgi:hypothetical protein